MLATWRWDEEEKRYWRELAHTSLLSSAKPRECPGCFWERASAMAMTVHPLDPRGHIHEIVRGKVTFLTSVRYWTNDRKLHTVE